MILRNRWGFDNEISFECDECGEEYHTDTADFRSALESMKEEGWSNSYHAGEYFHKCAFCCEDNDIVDEGD